MLFLSAKGSSSQPLGFIREKKPCVETNTRADSVLRQNDMGHQDTQHHHFTFKKGEKKERENISYQIKTQLRPLKGLTTFCSVGEFERNPAIIFCPLLAADCQSLGWAQPGIPGVEYPHLATWDAKDWRGVCFLLLPSINVITEVESQLERMEPDIPKRQTAK